MTLIKPTWMVEAIYNLTADDLRARGIEVILTDLDNTLIAWNNPDGTPELREWLSQMRAAGITVMVVSNNNEQRIAKALASLDLPFEARALKPLAVGIKKAIERLGVSPTETVMVGDQLLTDVLAGQVAGIRTILTKPLIKTDQWNTRINRFLEKGILKRLHRQGGYRKDLN